MSGTVKAAVALGAAAALAVAWYLVSPLWRTVVRDDASPLANQQQGPLVAEPPPAEERPATAAQPKPVVPAGPEVILRGALIPRAHEVKGNVLVISHEGQRTLRFEDFETINGPDVRIYLASSLGNQDIVDLGSIKGTRGNVNYEVPAAVDLGKYHYVLVWCEDFSVLFSSADLQ